ncbi:MAG: hypothetical protein IKS96_07150 [Fibrobacter sp.]|nr:hypothetical protein [Fibrobacter sp.]MBR6449704.1 hypothetical protein [Fibrobacter sp.]
MKKTDFSTKFMIDEGKTFAEWKEWVRKFKPTQAKAHVVQATLKNGKKFDRVYGSYVDAQNNAFALKQQLGAKNVKMFTSVNGGPLKLERSFDSAEDSSIIEGIAKKYAIDAVFPTSKGFSNEKGLLKRDSRKGLKPYEVTFVVKGKDGRPFNTKRSKMAASIEEAKRWAQAESKKYNGVTKIDVKEFKDSADVFDAAMGIKIPDNEKGTQRLTMEKVFKNLNPPAAWKKVKKGNAIIIKYVGQGPEKGKDVLRIEYFNPNVVAMTPRHSAVNMVGLNNVGVMVSKLGMEGLRSYNDSADDFENDASVATFPVKSNRNGSKYGYIEKICKTEAEAKALVDKLKKDGLVAMYRKVMYRDSADMMDRVKAKYCLDATKDQSNKKRYEVHYQATAPDGHIYSFIKEAVCTPGQLRGVMKTVEEEQKKKGVTLKKMFTKTVY